MQPPFSSDFTVEYHGVGRNEGVTVAHTVDGRRVFSVYIRTEFAAPGRLVGVPEADLAVQFLEPDGLVVRCLDVEGRTVYALLSHLPPSRESRS